MAEEENKTKKKRNIWDILSTASVASIALMVVILAVIVIGVGQGASSLGITGMIASDDASGRALELIEASLVQPGTDVSIIEIKENSGVYELTLSIDGEEYTSYMSKDGKYFFPQGLDINEVLSQIDEQSQQENNQDINIPKSDKPKAEAFVMSYCPYGLQFVKAFVPVIELLGDDADLSIKFVDYIMHGEKEKDENTVWYCTEKEFPGKFTEYLRCFVKEGDNEGCVAEVGIDETTLNNCIESSDKEFKITEMFDNSDSQFPDYPVHTELNTEYGVQGSPTFVINGKVVSVSRSPESIKQAICSAFNNPPADCDIQLSTSSEAPGLGAIGENTGSASSGSC